MVNLLISVEPAWRWQHTMLSVMWKPWEQKPIDALALVTQWRLMSQLVQGMKESPCFFPIFRTLEAGIQKKICPEQLKLTRVSVEYSLLPRLTSCLVVFSGCWLVENSDFDTAQVQIPYALEAPLTNFVEQFVFFPMSESSGITGIKWCSLGWTILFFCGMQAPKGDCCLACLRSTRYETSVGMTQPVSRLEMWKFPSQRIQEKQEDDLVQLMAGASSWHLEVDWKTLDGSFFPANGSFLGWWKVGKFSKDGYILMV